MRLFIIGANGRTGTELIDLALARGHGGGPLFALVRAVLRNQLRDLVVTEDIVRATELEWTIARPPKLDHLHVREVVGLAA